MSVVEYTTIQITKDLAKKLRSLGKKGDTYENILNNIVHSPTLKKELKQTMIEDELN